MVYLKGEELRQPGVIAIIPISEKTVIRIGTYNEVIAAYVYVMPELIYPNAILKLTAEEVEQQIRSFNNDNN